MTLYQTHELIYITYYYIISIIIIRDQAVLYSNYFFENTFFDLTIEE